MGYACPVCGDPQADGGHLANHLAFTAILGEDDHEAWLDEHAPGWGKMGEDELADVVVDDVEETTFPQVFEDTVGGLEGSTPDSLEERSGMLFDEEGFGDDAAHDHGRGHGPARAGERSTETDPEVEAIVEEAREMTREMREDGDGATDDGGADNGATNDGATNDGATNDGATNDGAVDGAGEDENA